MAAESGVRDMYRAAGFEPPRHLLWLDSPAEACWAVMILKASYDQLIRRIVNAQEQTRASRQQFEAIRGQMCKMAGVTHWQTLAEAAGRLLVQQGADPRRSFEMPLRTARLSIGFRFGGFPGYEGCDELPLEIETLRAGLLEF